MTASFLILFSYVIATFVDIKTQTIPDYIHIALLLSGVVNIVLYNQSLISSVSGFLILGIIYLIVAVKTDGLGGGDVKLIASTAFALGLDVGMFIAFIGFVCAGVYKKIQKEKKEVPLAPFMFIGVASFFILQMIFIERIAK